MFPNLLTQLQNPDPIQRIQAINSLGAIRHPRAKQALRYVYFHDPDATVRQAALQYLPGIQAKIAGGTMPSPPSASPKTPHQIVWDCVFCGTRDLTGANCTNCGAPRPTEADEKAAAQSNTMPADNTLPGSVNPGLRMAMNQPGNAAPANFGQQRAARRAQRTANRAAANTMALVMIVIVFLLVLIAFWAVRTSFFVTVFRR